MKMEIDMKRIDNEPVISVAEMRDADARTIANGTPGIELMMRAARGVFDAYKDGWADRRTLIFCGSGNNGGDGYALAGILKEHGHDVTILRTSEKLSEDGGYYYEKCRQAGVKMLLQQEGTAGTAGRAGNDAETNKAKEGCSADEKEYADKKCNTDEMKSLILSSDVIVDCMLGTGFDGVPRGNIKAAIQQINEICHGEAMAQVSENCHGENGSETSGESGSEKKFVISVDINSGMNGDTGQAEIAVKSDLTVSIGFYKTGLFKGRAQELIGRLVNVDIGIEL